jgi:hypothetical protein
MPNTLTEIDARTERRTVVIGHSYGHLEVLEELPTRGRDGSRRFKCKCLVVEGGVMCAAETVKKSHDLLGHRYRACKGCSDRHVRQARRHFGRINLPPGGRS